MMHESDMDARDWSDGPHTAVQRTCADCGDVVHVSAEEPYRLTVLCDKCYRVALATVVRSVLSEYQINTRKT